MTTPTFWAAAVSSYEEYLGYLAHIGQEPIRRDLVELGLISNDTEFQIPGFCGVCRESTMFRVDFSHSSFRDSGRRVPNWREHLNCQHCGLNNRMRAAIQFVADQLGARDGDDVYLTEEVTPMYHFLKKRFPRMVGSEFLHDGTEPGQTNAEGVHFEDMTRLSFPAGSFDHVLSFDVLEHIPDYRAALLEVARVLRPGGRFLWTAPFDINSRTTVIRAKLKAKGQVVHLMTPEYHGDPLSDQGVLCFQHFGWDILDDMRHAGFRQANIHFYWSAELGYLGGLQFAVIGER